MFQEPDVVRGPRRARMAALVWTGVWLLTTTCIAQTASEPERPMILAPRDDVSGLRVAEDLGLDLVLRDPLIANPLYLQFDERGRMWLVEYRQYPWPAGLKLLSRDNVWRNVYEPPFPPPPPHPLGSPFRGRDRISIHEDADGDGVYEKHQVFLDGLNLATAALPGRRGVFVMNPPYLLYYADHDRDDRPDHETPRILLSGFGIEDTHSIANSLRWGPDGWIYGAHGSTVSASVVRHGPDNLPISGEQPIHTMGQFVWRYHPERHQYEVYAEGGGNAFGIEFDSVGRVYSGHNGGDTRGFYYVQGGYYLKNFGKHGSHSNPYTFGYYPAMRHPPVERFTHTFEIYEGENLPENYHGKLFGTAPHLHYVIASEIRSDGSGRQTRDLGKVIDAGDQPRDDWFTPVDIQTGPDGNLYLADWHAIQANHYKGHEGQTNAELGRVYRLRPREYAPSRPVDFPSISSNDLVTKWLVHPNRWQRETALRLLAERNAQECEPQLRALLASPDPIPALNGLWALYQLGLLQGELVQLALRHPAAEVRTWAVRLVGDEPALSEQHSARLLALAESEPNVEVRLQLACTARRMSAYSGLAILGKLLAHQEDAEDVFLPLAIWWGVEAHADAREAITRWAEVSDHWNGSLAEAAGVFPKLVRRAGMRGTQADLEWCARLLELAPSETIRQELANAFLQAYRGRALPTLPEQLLVGLSRIQGPFSLQLGLRRGDESAIAAALVAIEQVETDEGLKVELIRTLGEVRGADQATKELLLKVLKSESSEALRLTTLSALQQVGDPEIAGEVLQMYSSFSPELREAAVSLLSSRGTWAFQLLRAVESEVVSLTEVSPEVQQRLRLFQSDELARLRDKLFPLPVDDAQVLGERLESVEAIARRGQGNPLAGQDLFHGTASCGKCHQMFGRGGEVGPDLTSYNRNQLRLMLMAIINPSGEIREGFETLNVSTVDGRLLSGFKLEENPRTLVLRMADGQTATIPKEDVDELTASKLSLMPVGLLDGLTEEQIRDLIAFLTSTTPPL